MSTLNPSGMLNVLTAANPLVAIAYNFDVINQFCFMRSPTKQDGEFNEVNGPPTTGAHILWELWTDANGALWRCVTAGTPGTWLQLEPAMMEDFPEGDIVDNYRVTIASTQNTHRWDAGDEQWVILYAAMELSFTNVRINMTTGNLEVRDPATNVWYPWTMTTMNNSPTPNFNTP